MQLSLVCSKLREAATCVASLRLGLLIGVEPRPNLGSHLLTSWAEHLTALELFLGAADATPGLHGFLAAAKKVSAVQIDLGAHLLNAAKADHILSKLDISELSVWGYWMPSFFPQTLQKLSFLIGHHYLHPGHDEQHFQEAQADSVLYRLERLPHLHTLRIKLQPEFAIRLSCPVQLPSLRSLYLRFAVEDELDPASLDYDLSWVHRQPAVTSLSFEIYLASKSIPQHAAMLKQLMGLRIDRLHLDLRGSFTHECQTLWAGLRSVQALHLQVYREAAFPPRDALNMVPGSCAKLLIEPRPYGDTTMYINWAALSRHAANIRIDTDSRYREGSATFTLHLLGECDLARIQSFQQPWQLYIGSRADVFGLPNPHDGRLAGSASLLQNAAAHAAGWTAETF